MILCSKVVNERSSEKVDMLTNALKRIEEHWWHVTDDDGLDIPLTSIAQTNVLDESPIHIAAWKGTAADVQCLLDNGADIQQVGDFGMTPLHYAYMGGNKDIIKLLLRRGANPNVRCDHGLRPGEGRPNITIDSE